MKSDLRGCRLAEALPSGRIPPPIGRRRPAAIGVRQAEEGHQDGATLPPFCLTRKHLVRITELRAPFSNIHMKIRTAARGPGRGRSARCLSSGRHTPDARRRDPPRNGGGRPHGLRWHRSEGLQGPHSRRAAQHPGTEARSDSGEARRRGPGRVRRRAGNERKSRLRRRTPDRGGLVFDWSVFQGADRGHHADCGDEGRDRPAATRRNRAGAPRASRDSRGSSPPR